MKFVFFVHSFITYYVSLGVIEKNNYKRENCVFFLHRGFSPPNKFDDATYISFPFEFYPIDSFPYFFKFWKGSQVLRSLDSFLSEATSNTKFHFFTPQSRARLFQLIESNKLCSGFSYIEEGSLSYWKKEEVDKNFPSRKKKPRERLLSFLNYPLRLESYDSYYKSTYANVYGIKPSSFPNYERRILVDLKVDAKSCPYENILVFDALVEHNHLRLDTLYLSIIHLIKYLNDTGVYKLYYKFHPTQLKSEINIRNLRELFQLFKKQISFIELPSDASLEEICFNSKANFFVFVSSIGIYAAMAGRKVYSLAEIVKDIDPSFKFSKESLPSVFRDNVTFLTI